MIHAHARYEFGDFVLEADRQRLLRRDTGATIPLSGRLFDTLLYLVQHAGDVLDKETLLKAIWPDLIVEENSLAQNVSALRQLLGEVPGEHRYIATVARRGYRFVALVVPADAAEEEPRARVAPAAGRGYPTWSLSRLALLLVAIAGVAAGVLQWRRAPPDPTPPHSLAILPFKPLLPGERNESLELGMAESLIAALARDDARAVSPLSSVRRYASLETDALAAGRELGVETVLDGSLQRSGDRLRVSVRLLHVAEGRQLWAHRFDQEFTTIFEVQDAIATRVAEALSWPGSARRAQSDRPRHTRDPEAYALYASGRFAWTRQTEASLRRAIAYYEQAIERDPTYALAYAGLADSYAVLGVFGIEAPHDVFPRARVAAERALSLAPDLAAAHSALGHIKAQYEHDWEGAARDYGRALELDASLALTHHRRGLLYAMQGDVERALAASGRAQQLEPLWLPARAAAANFLYYAGRYDESIAVVEQVLALDERADNARAFLIRDLIATGDHRRALRELDRGELQMPGSHAFRAQALALSGDRDAARTELARLLELSKRRYVAAFDVALVYAALDDHANALLWLERAMQDRSTLLVFLAQEPMLAALRHEPRFAALVQRIGIYRRTFAALGAARPPDGDRRAAFGSRCCADMPHPRWSAPGADAACPVRRAPMRVAAIGSAGSRASERSSASA
jgi:DNA-binding winged helix-turn-helix (wHTH) protein/TolB-like protein/tetratricopeptide (TPR) repeat protein